jgi:PAS domain S-box-containing protein
VGLGLASIIALSAVAANAYLDATRDVAHTLEIRQGVYEWQVALLDAETGARGYLATGQRAFLEPYEAALARERSHAAGARELVAGSPEQLANVEATDRDARGALDELAELITLAETDHRGEALARLTQGENKRRMDLFRASATAVLAEEERLLGARRAASRSRRRLAFGGAMLLALASIALLALAWTREQMYYRLVTALGKDAGRRLDALSTLAAAMAEARTRAQVADVIVTHGMSAVGADTCTLYELDAPGRALVLTADRGVAPDVLDRIRRITPTSGNPASFASMLANEATWAEGPDDYETLYPDLAKAKAEGRRARSFWSVPLHAEGRSVGLLGAGFYESRTFSPEERVFAETVARHVAQALLRASRLEREDEARRWFETTLRSIGDAVITTDAEGNVSFMNPVAEALTGWPLTDARGKRLEEVFAIFAESSGEIVESPVTKVLREGKVVGLANHTVLRPRQGPAIPIADSGAPILGGDGATRGVVLVFRDGTEEKRELVRSDFLAKAGEALVGTLDHLSMLDTVTNLAVPSLADWCALELVPAGSTLARQVAVAHVNPDKVRFARELGERYPPDPDARTGVPEVLRSGKSELYVEIPAAMLEAGARDAEHLRMIQELKLSSAMVVPLRVHGRTLGAMTFVYAESGRRYGPADLLFAEDFARRAALAIENTLALAETEHARSREHELRAVAEAASRTKDEFLATVSHELRTPLNAILGWTVMLRRRALEEGVDHGLAIVERNARLQTKLIEDVLDVARINSGKLALHLGAAQVTEVVQAAVETIRPAALAKNILVRVDVAGAAMPITADADRLQQVVWNLLSNAVKFTPKGGEIKVQALQASDEVSIRVSDSGEGIRADVLPLIFDRFHQADASITRRHGGLGLGLAIVKQLVVAHGGTVRAESGGEGHGATFTVTIPARASVPAITQEAAGARVQPPSGRPTSAPRLDGLRVVVVDDEEDALTLVGEVLRERGAEVHVATSAREALDMFGRVLPHVIVSDIGMPEMDGLSFMRRIRALPEGGTTPAVALTAYSRVEDTERALAAGFQVHVTKPIEPARLVTVVARLGGVDSVNA